MPVVGDEVPQWKKELIQKKQMWKRSGGWSVPPVAASRTSSKTGFKVQPPDFKMEVPNVVLVTPTDVVDSNNNGSMDKLLFGSVENVNFLGSVSELKTIFQPDDVFTPLTNARSEENISDGPVVLDSHRRASTSTQFSGYYEKPAIKKHINAVPKMEDFLKKYRQNTRKTVVVDSEVDSPRKPVMEKPKRKRSETVYFVDMNHDELPPPNTVRQTVKVFEEPVKTEHSSTKPDIDEMTSSMDVRPVALPRARDVVRKFEAKIKSNSGPPKPPRATRPLRPNEPFGRPDQNEPFGRPDENEPFGRPNQNDPKPQAPRKPAILSSDPHSRKESGKRVSFNTEAEDEQTLNLVVQNDGPTNLDSTRNDLKTVTINTNKSIIIKTV